MTMTTSDIARTTCDRPGGPKPEGYGSISPASSVTAAPTLTPAPSDDGSEAAATSGDTSTTVSCAALVAGTTVGAGILALPAKTIAAGFGPSAIVLVLGWLYMLCTGLLIAEVNIRIVDRAAAKGDGGDDEEDGPTSSERSRKTGTVSMNTMIQETLGSAGAALGSLAFGFLHYALLAAYTVQGGQLLRDAVATRRGSAASAAPAVAFSATFVVALGLALFGLRPRHLERLNTALVVLVVVAFLRLLAVGAGRVDAALLLRADFPAVVDALPLMPVVYTFQTVVPTVCTLLRHDAARVRTALAAGTGVPLFMFLSWAAVILGTVPYDPAAAVVDPLAALRASGSSLGDVVLFFSLVAVATSYIGFAYGLVDFFADLFRWESPLSAGDEEGGDNGSVGDGEDAATAARGNDDGGRLRKKLIMAGLVVLPPIAVATLDDPTLFFSALDNAGIYGILVVFGLVPTAMAWAMRYGDGKRPSAEGCGGQRLQAPVVEHVVPGGRMALGLLFFTAAAIIALGTYQRLFPVVTGGGVTA